MTSRIEIKPGFPGMQGSVYEESGNRTYYNAVGEVAQVSTITIGTATATDYNVSINGIVSTYSAVSGDTAAEIAEAFAAEINLNGVGVYATYTATTVILTANTRGIPFTAIITGGGAGYALALTTAAASASVIEFGRAVVRATSDAEGLCRNFTADDGSQVFLGVAVFQNIPQVYDPVTNTASAKYFPRNPVVVKARGSIWVEVEGTVTVDSPVYMRKAANGALNKIGVFAGASGTGLTQLTGARYISGGTGLAELELTGLEAIVID